MILSQVIIILLKGLFLFTPVSVSAPLDYICRCRSENPHIVGLQTTKRRDLLTFLRFAHAAQNESIDCTMRIYMSARW